MLIKNKGVRKMVGIDNDSNFESYEFEKTYDFSVEIPIVDEDTGGIY